MPAKHIIVMTIICKACNVPKEHNSLNFKSTQSSGKTYLEKTCKTCRQSRARLRALERYHNDESFRARKLFQTNNSVIKNQSSRNEAWKRKMEWTRIWKKNNPEKVKLHYLRGHKKRWTNPKYRVSKNMSNRVCKLIRDKNRAHVFDVLGYSIESLISHLERQFKPGMSWDNYGEWHIDHIRPVASFSFESKQDPEFKECWRLSNLQPLWELENLQKADSLIAPVASDVAV